MNTLRSLLKIFTTYDYVHQLMLEVSMKRIFFLFLAIFTALSANAQEHNFGTSKVHMLIEYKIKDGSMDTAIDVVKDISELVSSEPRTLNFEFYLSSKPSTILVFETYESTEAFAEHWQNISSSDLPPAFFALVESSSCTLLGGPLDDPIGQNLLQNCENRPTPLAGFNR